MNFSSEVDYQESYDHASVSAQRTKRSGSTSGAWASLHHRETIVRLPHSPTFSACKTSHLRAPSTASTCPESLSHSLSTLSSCPSTPGHFPSDSSPTSSFPMYCHAEEAFSATITLPSHSRHASLDSQVALVMDSTTTTAKCLERAYSIQLPFRRFNPTLLRVENTQGGSPDAESRSGGRLNEQRPPSPNPRHVDPRIGPEGRAYNHSRELTGEPRASGKTFQLSTPPRGLQKRLRSGPKPGLAVRPAIISTRLKSPSRSLSLPCSSNVKPRRDRLLIDRLCDFILVEAHGYDVACAEIPLRVEDAVIRCLDDINAVIQRRHATFHSYDSAWEGQSYGQTSSSTGSDWPSGPSSRKRNSKQASDGNENTEGGGPTDGDDQDDTSSPDELQRKRPKIDNKQTAFSCPFRKRNPVRFNIRDHENCCRKPIIGVPELKRHIRTYHRREVPSLYQCRRCKKGFPTEDALDRHSELPKDQMCEPASRKLTNNPEDGITDEMDKLLTDRKANNKIQTWDQICRLIFPSDTTIPPSCFEPVIESHEVRQELHLAKHELCSELKREIEDQLPDVLPEKHFQLLRALEVIFDIHVAYALQECRNRVAQPFREQQRSNPLHVGSLPPVAVVTRPPPVPGSTRPVDCVPTFHMKQGYAVTHRRSYFPSETFAPADPAPTSLDTRAAMPSPKGYIASRFPTPRTHDLQQQHMRDSAIVLQCEVCMKDTGTCGCPPSDERLALLRFDELPDSNPGMDALPQQWTDSSSSTLGSSVDFLDWEQGRQASPAPQNQMTRYSPGVNYFT